MKYKYAKAILDADFILKIGSFHQVRMIEDVLVQFAEKLLIHRYVYSHELIAVSPTVKDQLVSLIHREKIMIVSSETITDPVENRVYLATVHILKQVADLDMGEIFSLAYAKTKNIPVLFSDERILQKRADEILNVPGSDQNVKIYGLSDFVLWMKEMDMQRKWARDLWRSNHLNREDFNRLWPPKIR